MIFTQFDQFVFSFLKTCQANNVELLLVGGGAVNFYGYKRHSADVDFWIHPTKENFENLLNALNSLGYEINNFPDQVLEAKQNITIKASPDFHLELITNFNPGKSFKEAYESASIARYGSKGEKIGYRILSYDDLILSKIKASRPKDLLDIMELKRLNTQEE